MMTVLIRKAREPRVERLQFWRKESYTFLYQWGKRFVNFNFVRETWRKEWIHYLEYFLAFFIIHIIQLVFVIKRAQFISLLLQLATACALILIHPERITWLTDRLERSNDREIPKKWSWKKCRFLEKRHLKQLVNWIVVGEIANGRA